MKNRDITVKLDRTEDKIFDKVQRGELNCGDIYINLTYRNKPYIIDDNAEARIQFDKPDKTTVFKNLEIDRAKNRLIFQYDDNMTAIGGICNIKLGLYLPATEIFEGGLIKSTMFKILVEDGMISEDKIVSSDDFSALTDAMTEADRIIIKGNDLLSDGNIMITTGNQVILDTNTAISSANTATENANTATINANNATSLANAKAELANTAAINADNAKSDAINATASANIATTNANNAATNAQDTATNLETTYAPRLTGVESQLAQKANQADFETEVINRTNSVSTEKLERLAEVAVERARINSFTALATGSTTGDAELIDGRVGADGVVYPNIGDAIRNPIKQLTGITRNLADISAVQIGKAWNLGANTARAILNILVEPNTDYVISYNTNSFDAITWVEKETEASTLNTYLSTAISGFTRKAGTTTRVLCIQFSKTNISLSDFVGLNLQVEKGTNKSTYVQNKTANDIIARLGNTYVTPEMYGAIGDGITDDTEALKNAISSGASVFALKSYKTSSPIIIDSQRLFVFNLINYSGANYAIKISGQNIKISGNSLNADNGNGIAIGETGLTYNCEIDINSIRTPNGNCYKLGGSEPVSQCIIKGTQCQYGINAVYFNLVNYWVGQIAIYDIKFFTSNVNGKYAFYANGGTNPLTGLTVYNISFEGSHGGFEFVNSQAPYPIETLHAYGVRASEMTIRDGYKLIRYTGSGVIRGDIFVDAASIESIDFSGAAISSALSQSFRVRGRILGHGTTFKEATIIYNKVVPTLYETYGIANNPTFTNDNLPPKICIVQGGLAIADLTFPYIGAYEFIADQANTVIRINGTDFTLNELGDSLKVTVMTTGGINRLLIALPGGKVQHTALA